MHRNRNPCNYFLIVKMARGPSDDDDVAQYVGHPANTKSCSLGLQHIYILLDVFLCSIAEYFYELCRILASP